MFCLWLSLPSALATQMYCAAQLASQHQAMYVIKWLHHRLISQPQLHSFFFIFCYFLLISIFSFFYCTCYDFWHLSSLHPITLVMKFFKMLLSVWFMESETASLGTFSKIFIVGYSLALFKLLSETVSIRRLSGCFHWCYKCCCIILNSK